jgi:hypothetical protein
MASRPLTPWDGVLPRTWGAIAAVSLARTAGNHHARPDGSGFIAAGPPPAVAVRVISVRRG